MKEPTAQQKAEEKRSVKRKGTPTFSAVRFKELKLKSRIDEIINLPGGTREAALIAAFDALEEKLIKK
jgi:hypothetical protein